MMGALAASALAAGLFFDDFSQPDLAALQHDGWTLRTARGHPGVAGAAWGPDSVALVADPARRGNRLLRLTAQTNGTAEGTRQAQLCHERKFFRGTYAARVRFADTPAAGTDGDPVVQSFYAVAPLRFDFDPLFSEVDFEYLANGGWGAPETRLYTISWQTVRVEPWLAFNQQHETKRSFDGWHVLVMHVGEHHTTHFVDGRPLNRAHGRNVPVQPMALAFNLWFSPAGLQPPSAEPRVWVQDVDWVMHAADRLLPPRDVQAQVGAWRRANRGHVDTLAPARAPAACDI
jgi:hypothetical protein